MPADVSPTFRHIPDRALDRAFTSSFMAFASPSHALTISWCMDGRSCLRMQKYLLRSVTCLIALDCVFMSLLMAFVSPFHALVNLYGVCMAGVVCSCRSLSYCPSYTLSLLIVHSRHHLWPLFLLLRVDRFMVCVWQELSVHTDVSLIFHHIPDRACLCIPSFMAFFSPSHAPIIFMVYV